MQVMTMRRARSDAGVQTDYYNWLAEAVGVNQQYNSYWLLLKALHKREFIPMIPNDQNRAIDGTNLRVDWMNEVGIDDTMALDGPCSMLEMLIGLAIRMEFACDEKTMRGWFWVILDNCGLSRYADEAYYDLRGVVVVPQILDKIIKREYHRNGQGGLFPLRHPNGDQKRVEIWYQMNAYILENYSEGRINV